MEQSNAPEQQQQQQQEEAQQQEAQSSEMSTSAASYTNTASNFGKLNPSAYSFQPSPAVPGARPQAAAAAPAAAPAKASSTSSKPNDDRSVLQLQLEYYFSQPNLRKDRYLLQQMNEENYVRSSLIANFPAVMAVTKDTSLVLEVMQECPSLEVSGTLVRAAWSAQEVIVELTASMDHNAVTSLVVDGPVPLNIRRSHRHTWFIEYRDATEAKLSMNHILSRRPRGSNWTVITRVKPLKFYYGQNFQQMGYGYGEYPLFAAPYEGAFDPMAPPGAMNFYGQMGQFFPPHMNPYYNHMYMNGGAQMQQPFPGPGHQGHARPNGRAGRYAPHPGANGENGDAYVQPADPARRDFPQPAPLISIVASNGPTYVPPPVVGATGNSGTNPNAPGRKQLLQKRDAQPNPQQANPQPQQSHLQQQSSQPQQQQQQQQQQQPRRKTEKSPRGRDGERPQKNKEGDDVALEGGSPVKEANLQATDFPALPSAKPSQQSEVVVPQHSYTAVAMAEIVKKSSPHPRPAAYDKEENASVVKPGDFAPEGASSQSKDAAHSPAPSPTATASAPLSATASNDLPKTASSESGAAPASQLAAASSSSAPVKRTFANLAAAPPPPSVAASGTKSTAVAAAAPTASAPASTASASSGAQALAAGAAAEGVASSQRGRSGQPRSASRDGSSASARGDSTSRRKRGGGAAGSSSPAPPANGSRGPRRNGGGRRNGDDVVSPAPVVHESAANSLHVGSEPVVLVDGRPSFASMLKRAQQAGTSPAASASGAAPAASN